MPKYLPISLAAALFLGGAFAQTPEPQTPAPDPAVPHGGQIIIQSHGEPPAANQPAPPAPDTHLAPEDAKVDVSDTEREALRITAYDLDLRLNLQRSSLTGRARLTVRNAGDTPLRQVPLQISSTLRFSSASLLDAAGHRTSLPVAQHRFDTDADHTGAATEGVFSLPAPLAPGASASLDLFYEGTVAQNDGRLTRLGASASQGRAADWDSIGPTWTGLRGFGNVLWYPVASPQLFLSEGNTLFSAIGRMRQQDEATRVQLHLSVEYTGEPPVAAYFCARRTALKAVADDPGAPTATGSGIASADFGPESLGFRVPSLFIIGQSETLLGGASTADTAPVSAPVGISSSNPDTSASPAPAPPAQAPRPSPAAAEGPFLALSSDDPAIAPALATASDHAASLLAEWLGPRPLSAVTLLDHSGQPFQDGPLLVAPASTLETSPEAPALVYSLTHGWVQTGQPWMDEGLAQFFALLWVEGETGRGAALSQLQDLLQPVALAEPDLKSATDSQAGQPLVSSSDELFYRRKAAAVWWMLRDLAGDQALRSALAAWRVQPPSHDPARVQALAFEHLLEKESGKDLGWFFADWVLRDRGLPDLSIADVAISSTAASTTHPGGQLVAVTVRNEGGAAADVPLTLRSGQFTTTQRIRVAGFGQITQRILLESPPTEVQVNDGSVPELRTSIHTRQFAPAAQQP